MNESKNPKNPKNPKRIKQSESDCQIVQGLKISKRMMKIFQLETLTREGTVEAFIQQYGIKICWIQETIDYLDKGWIVSGGIPHFTARSVLPGKYVWTSDDKTENSAQSESTIAAVLLMFAAESGDPRSFLKSRAYE